MVTRPRVRPSVDEGVLQPGSRLVAWMASSSAASVVLLPEGVEAPREPERSASYFEAGVDPREKILALYDEYRPRLSRYLRSLHLKPDFADEVIQETFMRLTREVLEKRREIENVQGWIVRVAHNLAVDLLRKERKHVNSIEDAPFALDNYADPASSPEEAYSIKERSTRMEAALSNLRPLHKHCFLMRARGFRYKDIGVAIGISEQRAAFIVKQAAVHLAAVCE